MKILYRGTAVAACVLALTAGSLYLANAAGARQDPSRARQHNATQAESAKVQIARAASEGKIRALRSKVAAAGSFPDPAEALNETPVEGMMYDSAPCPSAGQSCARGSAPLAGDGKFLQISDYYMGGTFAVYAGVVLPSAPAGAGLPPSGQGFIRINDTTVPLSSALGTPTLTGVTGGASGTASFTTSTGASGSIDLVSDQVTARQS